MFSNVNPTLCAFYCSLVVTVAISFGTGGAAHLQSTNISPKLKYALNPSVYKPRAIRAALFVFLQTEHHPNSEHISQVPAYIR